MADRFPSRASARSPDARRAIVTGGRARSVAAAFAVLIASACRPDRTEPTTAHSEPSTTYLVAERYQRAGNPSTVDVPTALVGGERRPVLANAPGGVLASKARPSRPGEVVLKVHVPEAMRGKLLRLSATTPSCAPGTPEFDPHVVTAPGAVLRVRVHERAQGSSCPVAVSARAEPETTYTSGPIDIPAGARLRFATGVEDDVTLPPSGARFAITVIEGDVETPLVETRSDVIARRWTDHEVDLSGFAGRTVRLRFDADAGPLEAMWGDPTIVPARRGAQPLNVLLISLDTLRADRLGSYGYHRMTSAAIDWKLAVQGALFEHAYAQYPQTFGSHMTLFTGLYPCVHGLPGPKGARRALGGDMHTLAELLRAAGYRTGAVTEDGYLTATVGFDRGFGSFTEFTRLSPAGYPMGMVAETFGDGMRWIAREHDRPWFLFLHTFQVHAPYEPPPGYAARAVGQRGESFSDSDRYDGEILYTDENVSELLTFLDTKGLAHRTLVILISDHGEQFGEHDAWGHGNTLYNTLLHVPLIMRAPGIVPRGRRISDVVGLIDVVPTVLDVLGLPAYGPAQGRSLVPLWRGGSLPERTLFAEEDTWFQLVGAFAPPYKWIFSADGVSAQAFDLLHDPGENKDLAASLTGRGEPLLAEFRAACASAQEPPRAPPLDRSVRDKLRALGYVQ